MTSASDPGFAVYVHWPFCASKCPYCDFNSHVRHATVDQERYLAAFKRELAIQAERAPERAVHSIFFGGGTPSLMKPETVGAIIEAISSHWNFEPGVEITLEANPTSVEAERFRGYRAAGVNRVSLGVQAMNDADLRALGRLHSADEAMRAVDIAATNFDRFSFDLIYARPGQTVEAWRDELQRAIAIGSDHLSLYQLTIEPGTWFEKLHAAGKLAIPNADLGRALWDVTQETCDAAGMPAYEISNHARPGSECRHNLVYWRYGEYAAIGPGAHGRLIIDGKRTAFSNELHPETWLQRVESEGEGVAERSSLTPEEQADEYLLMSLRLREGIDPARYAALKGRPLDNERVDFLVTHGMVARRADGHVAVTPEGFPVLDAVVADLAA
ncbi:radical SAM family heme chaperone HemW [Terrarubrum flagellatum]|uniref:radical SAM family heme chaperone HemW n=1 Tax=Terrirubrum flagellatum TaxID=2895980 RepID=UPI0031454E7C